MKTTNKDRVAAHVGPAFDEKLEILLKMDPIGRKVLRDVLRTIAKAKNDNV